jgi:uncharacterized protein (DUF342 family)
LGKSIIRGAYWVTATLREWIEGRDLMLSNEMLDRRTCNICIKRGFASEEQLERARREQQKFLQKTNAHMGIAEILVELGIITEEQKESILFPKKDRKPDPSAGATPKKPVEPEASTEPEASSEPEAPSAPAPVTEETIEPISPPSFQIKISWDRMEAHLHPNEADDPKTPTLTEVKKAMEAHGIRYGFLSDAEILEHLAAGWPPENPIKIAAGKPPEPGIDARVEIHFEKDPLKAGAIDESDRIDFRDRGEIPQVKEGDLMAVKIPPREGVPGKDVREGMVPPPQPKDLTLECGEGTVLSEDGLQILAAQAGRPVVSRETVFSVIPDLKISGDVGLGTGHIAFDGNIEVEGSIHDGFRVLGKNLSVQEIGKAELRMTGSIEARGGIIGADIQAEGMVTSTHIHNSRLDVSGDVVVHREIYDSTILTSGACIIERGKIINSKIIAKKGVEVLHLGSTGSSPCHLTVGVAYRIQKEIEGINEQISELKKELNPFREQEKRLQEKVEGLDKEIEALAEKEAPCMAQQVALKKNLEGARERLTPEQIAKAEMALKQLDARLGQIQQAVEEKFSAQERATEAVEAAQEAVASREKEIGSLEEEIARLTTEAEKDPGVPLVKVYGTLASRTVISGPLSSVTVEEDYNRVRVKETEGKGPHVKDRWQMVITRL